LSRALSEPPSARRTARKRGVHRRLEEVLGVAELEGVRPGEDVDARRGEEQSEQNGPESALRPSPDHQRIAAEEARRDRDVAEEVPVEVRAPDRVHQEEIDELRDQDDDEEERLQVRSALALASPQGPARRRTEQQTDAVDEQEDAPDLRQVGSREED